MAKLITVLKRAEVTKASESYNVVPGDIICIVKGSTGNVYTTTLRRNKQHSCTCPGYTYHSKCYHVTQLKAIENARYDAEKAIAEAQRIVTAKGSDTLDSEISEPVAPVVDDEIIPGVKRIKGTLHVKGDPIVQAPKIDGHSVRTASFFSGLPSRKKPAA